MKKQLKNNLINIINKPKEQHKELFENLRYTIGLGYFLNKTYEGKYIFNKLNFFMNYGLYTNHYYNGIYVDNIIRDLINTIPRKFFDESRELEKYEEIFS